MFMTTAVVSPIGIARWLERRIVRLTDNEIRTAKLYQTAETLTHLRHCPRPSKAPISHWTTVRFCNGCPSGGVRSMSQGLRVLVLVAFLGAIPIMLGVIADRVA